MKPYLTLAILFFITTLSAQVGAGTPTPSEKATLEVSSQNNGTGDFKGFMTARVDTNTERDMIPATGTDTGLQVFVVSTGCLNIWNGSAWEGLRCNTTRSSSGTPATDKELHSSKKSIEGKLKNPNLD